MNTHLKSTAFFWLIMALVMSGSAHAQGQLFETTAPHAYLIEAESGTILYSKEADELIPPASLAKLMTMEVVFNALRNGRLSLDDEFEVSEYAWREGGAMSGGSTMFAELGSFIRLEDLIQGVIIQSANDGCIIIAEGMAGSEQNFAQLMTERARQIGLERSVFKNSTGLPAEGQHVSIKELVTLARHIWREYPDYYAYYSQPDFTWNGITQRNRNPLLRTNIGADGMKTGYTEASGYAIVGSAERDGRRFFLAMSGMQSERERAEQARRVLEWGMRAFEPIDLFEEGEVVGEVRTYGGDKSRVALSAQGPVSILVPVGNRDRMTARIVYDGPVMAPVEAGTRIGSLRIWLGDTLSQETPLYAAESVATGRLHQRALDAIEELAIGWIR